MNHKLNKFYTLSLITITLIGLGLNLNQIKPLTKLSKRSLDIGDQTRKDPIANPDKSKIKSRTPTKQVTSPTTPTVVFAKDYFKTGPNGVWQLHWNYHQSQKEQQRPINHEEMLDFLNIKMRIDNQIKNKRLVSTFIANIDTADSALIELHLNQKNYHFKKTELNLVQISHLLESIQKHVGKIDFSITEDWKRRFGEKQAAIDNFANYINQLLGTTSEIENIVTVINVELEKMKNMNSQKVIAELKTLFHLYPDWFKPNDWIDLNNEWETKWEQDYTNFGNDKNGWTQINQLKQKLKANPSKIEVKKNVIEALQRHVRNQKRLQLRISTNKKPLISILGILNYYNPFLYIQTGQKFAAKIWINLIVDLLKFIFFHTQPNSDNQNILEATWNDDFSNDSSEKILDIFKAVFDKIILFLIRKK